MHINFSQPNGLQTKTAFFDFLLSIVGVCFLFVCCALALCFRLVALLARASVNARRSIRQCACYMLTMSTAIFYLSIAIEIGFGECAVVIGKVGLCSHPGVECRQPGRAAENDNYDAHPCANHHLPTNATQL